MTQPVKWKYAAAVLNAGRAGCYWFEGSKALDLFARAGRPCALPVFIVSNEMDFLF